MTTALLVLAAAAAQPDLAICADRPSKANGTCTVPVGHWQLEVSGADWVHIRDLGERVDVTSIGQTFVKLGLSDHSDVELGFTPYVHTRSSGGGTHESASGIGDVVVRYKHRLTGPGFDGPGRAAAFVKLPTASHDIGNRKVEGGLRFRRTSAGRPA